MGAALLELVRHELAVALRTKRVLVVLAVSSLAALLGGFLTLQASSWFLEELAAQAELGAAEAAGLVDAITREHRSKLVSMLAGLEHGMVLAVFADSFSGALLFRVMLFFVPWIALLVAFDRLATDVDSRALIFYGPRVPRWMVVLARSIAATAVTAGMALVCGGISVAFLAHAFPDEGLAVALPALGVAGLLLIPVAFAWSALILLGSSLVRRPFAALAIGVALMALWVLLGPIARQLADGVPPVLLLELLTPAAHRGGLFSGVWQELVGSVASWLVLGAAFLGLAIVRMERRELVS